MTVSGCARQGLNVLEQVRRKVSKEQNTVVQMSVEGAVDLKMRVFVANSVEAKAVWDYISAHPHQVPAPFVVLARDLHMAVSYESTCVNPSQASVADRLRKQIKTHAVKVLREAIADKSCAITTAMLRGYSGPMAPAQVIESLVDMRNISMPGHPGKRCILLPAKNKAARDEGRASGGSDKTNQSSPRPAAPRSGGSYSSASFTSTTSRETALYPSLQIPLTPASPDTSVPSTPGTLGGDDTDGTWESSRLTAHFPVNLFVTAIADGHMACDTQPKVQDRLAHIVRKVPKEQNTCVEVRPCLSTWPACPRSFCTLLLSLRPLLPLRCLLALGLAVAEDADGSLETDYSLL